MGFLALRRELNILGLNLYFDAPQICDARPSRNIIYRPMFDSIKTHVTTFILSLALASVGLFIGLFLNGHCA